MSKGILRKLKKARGCADQEVKMNLDRGDTMYAGGMASEGYFGGYRDALDDVVQALRGGYPGHRPEWWEDPPCESKKPPAVCEDVHDQMKACHQGALKSISEEDEKPCESKPVETEEEPRGKNYGNHLGMDNQGV